MYFFLNATATTEIYTLSLHDALPISTGQKKIFGVSQARANSVGSLIVQARGPQAIAPAQEEMRSVLRQRHHLQPQQDRSEEHTSELQSHSDLVCRLLLEKKKKTHTKH